MLLNFYSKRFKITSRESDPKNTNIQNTLTCVQGFIIIKK